MEQSIKSTDTSICLSTLDKEQLIDLLQHKTRLLITANRLNVPDRNYIESLTKEVKEIQEAIRSRQI